MHAELSLTAVFILMFLLPCASKSAITHVSNGYGKRVVPRNIIRLFAKGRFLFVTSFFKAPRVSGGRKNQALYKRHHTDGRENRVPYPRASRSSWRDQTSYPKASRRWLREPSSLCEIRQRRPGFHKIIHLESKSLKRHCFSSNFFNYRMKC